MGVDPSITMTGWADVTELGDSYVIERIKTYGTSTKDGSLESRIDSIQYNGLDHYAGEGFAIETNYANGRQAELNNAQLIGVLVQERFGHNFIHRIAPTSAKKALTGSGKASKEDMVAAASKLPGWVDQGSKKRNEAVADAVGVAICALKEIQNGSA